MGLAHRDGEEAYSSERGGGMKGRMIIRSSVAGAVSRDLGKGILVVVKKVTFLGSVRVE